MGKKLDNIFNECVERVLQGESIESCLASYPKEAAELEPLLRTALGFSWRASSVQARPEFKAQARLRLKGAQLDARQHRRPEGRGFFAWQRGWAFALTAILVMLFTGASTVAASSDALPDEPLYPVKLATEQTRLVFAFSDSSKASVHTQLAENRALEIAAMAHEGKTEQAAIVTERLAQHLEAANYAIQKVETAEVEAPRFTAVPEEAAPEPEPAAAPEPEEAAPAAEPEEAAPAAEPTPAPEPEEAAPAPEPEETAPAAEPEEAAPAPEPEETAPAAEPEEAAPAPAPAVAPEPDAAAGGKAGQLRQALGESTSRSLVALQTALEQAPDEAKPALRRAIETITEKSHKKPKPVPDAEDEGKGKGKGNGDKDEDKRDDQDKDKGKGNGDKDEDKRNDQNKDSGNNKGNGEDKGNGKANHDHEHDEG